jgi:hypothetical protein
VSLINIISYVLLFYTLILTNVKGLTPNIINTMYYGLILLTFFIMQVFGIYPNVFADSIVISLLFVSFYTYLTINSKNIGSAYLYINSCQIILPLYLLNTSSLWGQFVAIVLLEIVRLLGHNSHSNKKNQKNFVISYSVAQKLIYLSISYLMIFVASGKSNIEHIYTNIDEAFLIPICFMILTAFMYLGIASSKHVQQIEIAEYKSKNIIAFNYLYQFIIPAVVLAHIKHFYNAISGPLFVKFDLILFVFFTSGIIITFYKHLKETNKISELMSMKSLVFMLLSYLYIVVKKFTILEFYSWGLFYVLVGAILLLATKYKVKHSNLFKKFIVILAFPTPLSPTFYFLMDYANKASVFHIKQFFLLFYTILAFMLMISYKILNRKLASSMKCNLFATQRAIYIVCGMLIMFGVIIYEKI